jgi:CheY-like chemotaxis protein
LREAYQGKKGVSGDSLGIEEVSMIPQKAKILCVDDDPHNRKLLQDVLSPVGYEVLDAESGKEALEVIAKEKIDLVLLDVIMPGMDGYDVCRAIKGDEKTRNIPVVMITGLISKEDRIKGIEVGAEEFLTKPVDPAEVRARVKMLLKVKNLNEMRTGEILIELGLINEQQLQEALRISNEKNIKVGEALYSMGALSRDTICWGLSNQLNMNYVELSPEIVDKELIQKFSLDVLKQLQCLPLYETNAEIHFAISDPTDQRNMEAVKNLKPGKAVQLHLGLSEKIADVLSYYERETLLQNALGPQRPFQGGPVCFLPDDGAESRPTSDSEILWDDLVAELLSMPADAVYWLYKTTHECRLLARKGANFEPVLECPLENYSLFRGRMRQDLSSRFRRGETMMVLSDRSKKRQAAFKILPIDGIDKEVVRIERIPMFSSKTLERSHPPAPRLISEIKSIFEEHRRLVVGGPDKLFIKQCCYSLLMSYSRPGNFPHVFFLESEASIYLPQAAQLSGLGWDPGSFLKIIGEELRPFVFYEAVSQKAESIERCLSGFSSGHLRNVILRLPSLSAEAMQKVLSGYVGQPKKSFSAVFIEAAQLKSVF